RAFLPAARLAKIGVPPQEREDNSWKGEPSFFSACAVSSVPAPFCHRLCRREKRIASGSSQVRGLLEDHKMSADRPMPATRMLRTDVIAVNIAMLERSTAGGPTCERGRQVQGKWPAA